MSCLEEGPLRNGLRTGLDRFSGEGGLSRPFELLSRDKTVPSRLNPPNAFLEGGGGPEWR